MEEYKKQIINEYWKKQVNKKESCPKCNIGKLVDIGFVICDNCGNSPVTWRIVSKNNCDHPWDKMESTFGGGTVCIKCKKLI